MRLAGLELRRALPPGLCLLALGLALLLRTQLDPELPSSDVLPIGELERARLWRATLRAALWGTLGVFLGLALLLHAAGSKRRWLEADRAWLGSRPISRTRSLLVVFAGQCAALVALWLACASFVELSLPGGEPTLAFERRLTPPHETHFAENRPLLWRYELRSRTRRVLEAEVTLLHGGPALDIELSADHAGQRERSTTRLSPRRTIAVDVPGGDGPLDVELRALSGSARLVPETLALWRPGASEREGSLRLCLDGMLGSLAWLALALGLGAWMSAPTATALIVSLGLFAFGGGHASAWLPGAGWPEALSIIAQGRVPAPLEPAAIAGSLTCTAIGLGLALIGWRSR